METVSCTICKEQIQPGATKCVHCDSFQDWRGSLNLSSTILALLVALVSVLGFAGPVFKDLFTPRNSKLEMVGQPKVQDNIITVIFVNGGIRPGVVDHADAIITAKDGHMTADIAMQQLVNAEQLDASLVPPGAMKEFRLAPDARARDFFHLLDAAVDKRCNLHVFFTEFDRTTKEVKNCPIGCALLRGNNWELH